MLTARALPRHSSICPRTGFKALTAAGAAKAQISLGTSKRTLSGKAWASSPNSTSATLANVGTSRVNQPQVSKLGDKAKVSSKLMRPWLGRIPTKPQWLAGARTEPPVSEPRAKSHMRLDTAEAEPEDEPPLMRMGSAPLMGEPKWAFCPLMENASSSVMVLPTKRAPALSRLCTTGAVRSWMPDSASMKGWPPLVG